jgi:transposase
MEEVDEQELHVERVAALDLGKAALKVCVRVPHESKPGRRLQEVRGHATTTGALLALADWLHSLGVTRVVMESTSDYWKGVYWLLEAEGFECWLVNARDVKNVPGRPKTDKADAVWLAKVAERGMCRPSLVHPRPIRQLRDLTRYRRSLIHDRTREMQRVEKLLEDAQIKLSSVATDIFGASGRAMLEALIAGQRDPKVLAGPPSAARQDRGAGGGAVRVLQRPPRRDPADDAGQHRPAQRADRRPGHHHRGGGRPFRIAGGPAR